jgi:hypothetical protein
MLGTCRGWFGRVLLRLDRRHRRCCHRRGRIAVPFVGLVPQPADEGVVRVPSPHVLRDIPVPVVLAIVAAAVSGTQDLLQSPAVVQPVQGPCGDATTPSTRGRSVPAVVTAAGIS